MNTGLSVNNPSQWTQLLTHYSDKASTSGTRVFFISYSAPAGGMERFAQSLGYKHFPANSSSDRSDRINSLLGTQHQTLVFSAGVCPDSGVLAAAAGTVAAGGFFLLDLSAIAPRALPENNDYANTRESTRYQEAHRCKRSTQRMIRLLDSTAANYPETVLFINLANYKTTLADRENNSTASSQNEVVRRTTYVNTRLNPDSVATREQNDLFREAFSHLSSGDKTCIFLKGRRGRGKSSLLGRLAHNLAIQQESFKVTSLHRSALSSFQRQGVELDKYYVSAQNALQENTDILLVDEAASIPIAQLEAYLQNFKHVVLSTTTEGYEAAGRALDVRLLHALQSPDRQTLYIEPRKPWRWRENDPLESFVDQLLLKNLHNSRQMYHGQDSSDEQASDWVNRASQNCQIERLSQDSLAKNDALLTSLHALLDATHYQSTTKDLAHLLDADQLQIWVQLYEGEVCATLLAQHEGNIDTNLHNDIVKKKRRLPNQLLPQLLAQMANSTQALGKSYLRIVRIAVVAPMRRRKLASQLLTAVINANTKKIDGEPYQFSTHLNVDAIGASFATDASSMAFWKHHQFSEFHRGFRANPRSGRSAAAVMRSVESCCSHVLDIAVQIHTANTCAIHAIASQIKPEISSNALSERDNRLLLQFASAQRSMHDTLGALLALSSAANLPLQKPPATSQRAFEKQLRISVQSILNELGKTA